MDDNIDDPLDRRGEKGEEVDVAVEAQDNSGLSQEENVAGGLSADSGDESKQEGPEDNKDLGDGDGSKGSVGDGDTSDLNIKEGMEWYVVHVYSGFESAAKKSLQERIRSSGMADQFGAILIPQERVVEIVKGKKKETSKKFFPGYMLVQMNLNEDTWHLVKGTPKISGFVGDPRNPSPMSAEEVERVLTQISEGARGSHRRVDYQRGDAVKVTDGPFSGFQGSIEEVNPEKGKLKVLISIFGRATPVELHYSQVERAQ